MKPVNLMEYEFAAREKLSSAAYGYYAGGASDEISLAENRAAYDRIQILPYMLRDVSQRDLSTRVLGQKIAFPLLIAPMAMAALAHPDKELAIAHAAKKFEIPMCLSTLSTTSLEDIAETGVNRWFQLYVHKDRGLTRELVRRAEASGYTALVVTIDVPVSGYREYLEREPITIPEHETLANVVDYWDRATYPSTNAYVNSQFDPSLTWKDISEFVEQTNLPVLVKGVLRADDALKALDCGVAGIIVSNHGGRQLDTVPATIQVLPEIATALDGRCELLVDGGIRRGTDILKALALGAKAVLLGRPILWGLAVNAQAGVEDVLKIIQREYDLALALTGLTSSEAIPPDIIR